MLRETDGSLQISEGPSTGSRGLGELKEETEDSRRTPQEVHGTEAEGLNIQ